jgi:hypothetical protein
MNPTESPTPRTDCGVGYGQRGSRNQRAGNQKGTRPEGGRMTTEYSVEYRTPKGKRGRWTEWFTYTSLEEARKEYRAARLSSPVIWKFRIVRRRTKCYPVKI